MLWERKSTMSTARTKRRVACERNREDSSLEIWTIFAREHKNTTKGNYSIPSIIMEFPSHVQYINRYTSTNHRLIPHHSTLYPSVLSTLSTVLRRPARSTLRATRDELAHSTSLYTGNDEQGREQQPTDLVKKDGPTTAPIGAPRGSNTEAIKKSGPLLIEFLNKTTAIYGLKILLEKLQPPFPGRLQHSPVIQENTLIRTK
ncbi:hypothetical protein RUM43_009201 [Polyplax serrata]|uniref:Uncharacterized protein n=1 Tax=Polyplax serrata TaxID=468196 RepID=A0AAN8P7N4_POLSC